MGPFKCPDCGAWWAGFEHTCVRPWLPRWPNTTTWPTTTWPNAAPSCTCLRGYGTCPVHNITYTIVS